MKKDEGFMISYSDYDTIIKLAQKNLRIDATDYITIDIIVNKYAVKKLVNNHKIYLWQTVEKYKKDVENNKIAYDEYKKFKSYIEVRNGDIENGLIDCKMLKNIIDEKEYLKVE